MTIPGSCCSLILPQSLKQKDSLKLTAENEFQSPADFSDIRNIGLAYTTITEEEIEIQVNANLEDSSIDTYLDGILIRKSAYPSIKDLVKEKLSSLSFVL